MRFEPLQLAAASISLVALASFQAYGDLGHAVAGVAGEKAAGDVISQGNVSQGNFLHPTLEVSTTFVNENYSPGTWLMTDWDHDGIPDLVFIKTANVSSGQVEVHIASGSSRFGTRILEVPTTFVNADYRPGIWLMTDWDHDGIPDLVFIKTADTPSGQVEVHIASGSSRFGTRILEVPTSFVNENYITGTWLMTDWDNDGIPDLVFIKTADTPSRQVEVHIASGSSRFGTRILEIPMPFETENYSTGIWLMTDWDKDGIPDLVFIKTADTPSGQVEVHIASGSSRFGTPILEVPTSFVKETYGTGTWLMTDWDHDGIPDLVFIKTANTPNGHVEVHVAAGGKLNLMHDPESLSHESLATNLQTLTLCTLRYTLHASQLQDDSEYIHINGHGLLLSRETRPVRAPFQ